MKCCVILNPTSGSAGAHDETIRQRIEAHGGACLHLREPGDTERRVREAIDDGCDRVILAGGDGTVSEAVNALASEFDRVELGIVPLGTGNDLARSLGIPREQPDEALQIALEGDARPIDLIRITRDDAEPAYCVNCASGGFGGRIGRVVDPDAKRRWGLFAYWMTAAVELTDLNAYDLRMTCDGEETEMRVYGLAVANSCYLGGGFPIAPRARLDDGRLDLTVIPAQAPLDTMAVGIDLIFDPDREDDGACRRRARCVQLRAEPPMPFSVDGETVDPMDATFEILPNALRMVPGPDPVALTARDAELDARTG